MQSYASQRALPWKEGPFSLRCRWLLAELLAGSPTLSAKVLLSALSARGHFCEKPGSLSVALAPSGYAQLTMIVESSRAAPWRLAASSPTVTS